MWLISDATAPRGLAFAHLTKLVTELSERVRVEETREFEARRAPTASDSAQHKHRGGARLETHAGSTFVGALGALRPPCACSACRCEGSPSRRAKTPAADALPPPAPTGKKCVVHLHGKGERGGPTSIEGDVTHLRPEATRPAGTGAVALLPGGRYAAVRDIVAAAIREASCGRVIVHGSNGGATAAKLYCRGERFDNTLIGTILDDPVTDHATDVHLRTASGSASTGRGAPPHQRG